MPPKVPNMPVSGILGGFSGYVLGVPEFRAGWYFSVFFSICRLSSRPKHSWPKSLVSLGFEGHTGLFWPPAPLTWKTPTPPEVFRTQKFGFMLLFRFSAHCPRTSTNSCNFPTWGLSPRLYLRRFREQEIQPEVFLHKVFLGPLGLWTSAPVGQGRPRRKLYYPALRAMGRKLLAPDVRPDILIPGNTIIFGTEKPWQPETWQDSALLSLPGNRAQPGEKEKIHWTKSQKNQWRNFPETADVVVSLLP